MGPPEIAAYLAHLALQKNVASNTQKTALNAIVFMYRHVLDMTREILTIAPDQNRAPTGHPFQEANHH